ncbi:hypothetical protein PMAYCL1PPCAC_21232 [Pristionchus mayeri]|uniref:F-box domain-containing protein n=1 Tax=Pristionchus mayeri TaxID=1317129 RepID=A0AAN5CVZ0_9BILA|nr:hypothetical protein PMAYCL1PPCAC_21232 [Pristionchus mayeri]
MDNLRGDNPNCSLYYPTSSTMDFLSLTEDIHRKILKMVGIRDRMRLRMTCRYFETLVAYSDAGFFDSGGILLEKDLFSIDIGDASFNITHPSESEMDRILNLRRRLFHRISFGEFSFFLDDIEQSSDFVCDITRKFTIRILSFSVSDDSHLDRSLMIMEQYPASKFILNLNFLPETEKLLSIPSLSQLSISDSIFKQPGLRDVVTGRLDKSKNSVSPETLLELLAKHSRLCFPQNCLNATYDDLTRVIQIISRDTSGRTLRFTRSLIWLTSWLMTIGFNGRLKSGRINDQIDICELYSDRLKLFRFENYFIQFEPPLLFMSSIRFNRFGMSNIPIIVSISNARNVS